MADSTEIAREIMPAIASLGLDLYDVEITGSGRASVMRVLIDREGGVDLDAITRATEAIAPLLDQGTIEQALKGSYTLEVSSPGLERPLRRPEHFRNAVGSTASIKVRATAAAPARRIRGVLVEANDEGCELALDDAGTEHVAYDDIVQARTVFEWEKTPKKNVKEVARR